MVARLQKSIESLHEMGHPDYHEEYCHHLECSASLEDVKLEVLLLLFNNCCKYHVPGNFQLLQMCSKFIFMGLIFTVFKHWAIYCIIWILVIL